MRQRFFRVLSLLVATALGPNVESASQDNENAAEWDVSNPPGGYDFEIGIDTDEGTWMNLDVSPDGGLIVFDLLGDLYQLPIEGGEAKALTEGLAWDMQPRFSPDGQEIAFTSDRGGGDNIWIMNRDGSSFRAVSEEDFRLPNNPAWSPDGEFLAARKHFTSTRSLGAGEIWLYHKNGGGVGLQLNEKPNEQKDLGEPSFSPDGRHVYFSQDVTPGGVFEYSKDSNNRIYAVRRIDRETGDIDSVVEGFGGACRPTPSPDGRWLAFVRRERFQSKLFIHDLASGENHLLYSALDRDMQEIWAVHGVYANFAWTPDSRSIVFWAGGKIRRVDIGTGHATDIPFHVRQTHRMKRALRYENDPSPDRFETRMLRWVQVSPRGDRVVFQALGYLYMKSLPDGIPERLTRQSDHFENYPSFSRDGSAIVYVSWDDEELGAVRIVSADGGEGRKLTSKPGHYLEPALSPDGAYVIYRKAAGDYLRSLLWSKEPGLYVLPATGGEPRRLHKSGTSPHFGAEADRVYFTVQEDWNKRLVRSIRLDGTEERTHVESEVATEFRVSPDGRRLAFAEGFQAFYAPFVSASKPVKVGPKETAIPVTRVSTDAGEYLHWSGDAQRLYWTLGPTLFHRDLLAEESGDGRPLGFSVESDRPSGRVAFVDGRLITMEGDELIERGTILVEGNRIVAIGPADSITVPEGAFRVDASGATLMPGLIDVHWHGSQGTNELQPEANWENYASLAYGVTTAHDPSNDTSTFFAAAEMARAGLIVSPRLFSTGTILYGAAGEFRAVVESEEDARAHLKRLKAAGAFSVKSYNQPRRDQRQMIVKAARDLGMLVVNEGGALFEHNMTMVADGHTGIEHSLSLGAIYDDVVQFWSQTEVANTPTLVVAYGGIFGERYWYQHTNVWEDEHLLTFVPRGMIDAASRRRVMAPEEEYNHVNTARIVKRLHDAGVGIQLGAHGQREGLGAHWELWMFEQGGMTPHEALRVGTLEGARYLGMDKRLGSLKAGKLADIVVLERNPLEDLKNSTSVRYVMVNGRLYEAATLDEIGNHPRKRGAFWWERRGSTLP